MTSMLVWVIVTAVASSGLTAAMAWLAWRRWGQPSLGPLQDTFESRVKAGVLAAGHELLPALREQVKLGFQDALKDSHAAGIAEGTAKVVAGSAELLADSLNNLFGLKKK